MNEIIKDAILKCVSDSAPIKGTSLVVEVTITVAKENKDVIQNLSDGEGIVNTISDLVKSGDLVEVEYVLPSMDYRAKSMYFPKGTEVRIPS